jgi:hypothetical protein
MSSNDSKDKSELEPIAPETTILKINIKTTGDLITKEYDLIPFHPNMSDLRDLSNNSYMYFPSFVKITMKDLQKAGVGEDYPKIFLDLDKYVKLMKYVMSPEREEDNTLLTNTSQVKNYATSMSQSVMSGLSDDNTVTSLQKDEPLTEEEIITNNIELIRQLFFSFKSHFFILANDYVIGKSKYIPIYKPSEKINKELSTDTKKIPLMYTVTFELQLLDSINNPEAGDFMKMTCKAKKANIATDMMDIFGTNLGYKPVEKVSLPSILNTSQTTKNRHFGKMQKEWENRNRYMSELEKNENRKNMTPLQKKMADYDKQAEEYKKIPPLWLKETDLLDEKYNNFTIEMVQLWQEMDDIKKSNTEESKFQSDRLDELETKIELLVYKLLKRERKEPAEKDIKDFINTITESKYKKDVEDSINKDISRGEKTKLLYDAKQQEQAIINNKYVTELKKETGLQDKKEDLKYLEEEELALKNKYDNLFKTGDQYNAESVKNELTKVQTNIRKKTTDIRFIEDKYKEIATKWLDGRKKMKSMKESIETEKNKSERENEGKVIKENLQKKLELIKKKKEEYLLALFKEDEKSVDLLHEEVKKYKNKDKPFDDASTLKNELEELEKEYLEIASKSSYKKKTDGQIDLWNDYLTRYKAILSEIKRDERSLESGYNESLYNANKYKGLADKNLIEDKKEEIKNKLMKNKVFLKRMMRIIAVYEKYIQELKKANEDTDENIKIKIDKFESELEKANVDTPETSGGKKTQKKKHRKRNKKTKRIIRRRIKHKTLRKLKKPKKIMRKKKRTMRRRV